MNCVHDNLMQVVLAKEAGLSYAAIAMPTDYDCWKEGHIVNVTEVKKVTLRALTQNDSKYLRGLNAIVSRCCIH